MPSPKWQGQLWLKIKLYSFLNLIGKIKIPTTKLQGKPLALSFKPTAKTDEDRLLALMPKDENGTLPSYLPTNISMTPELTLNGEILLSKGNYRLGSDVKLRYGIHSPNSSLPSLVNKDIIAGEYHAIGYNLQGMSQQQLEATKKTLEETKAKLEEFQKTKQQTALNGLTKHDLTGAILQAGVQSYFAVNQAQDTIAQQQANIVQNPNISFGTFSTNLTTQYRYGIATRTKPTGLMMDIDRIVNTTVDKDNVYANVVNFNRTTGARKSLNENLIPEQLFDNPETEEKETEGISAVKAIVLASQQGQTIYTITKNNYNEILPKLNHGDDVMMDIRNAINARKQVTVHQSQLNFKGCWSDNKLSKRGNLLMIATIVLYILALVFFLLASKNYLIPLIYGQILKWDKFLLHELKREIIEKKRFGGYGIYISREPWIKYHFYYKDILIDGEVIFREQEKFSDKKMLKFLESVKSLTFYINPKEPHKFIVIKPENRFKYVVVAMIFIIIDVCLRWIS